MTDQRKCIVFHMGTPKTGTTSLQKYLLENKDNLSRCGWACPDLSFSVCTYRKANGWVLFELLKKYNDVNKIEFDDEWIAAWHEIETTLEHSNVIITCEDFWKLKCFDYVINKAKYLAEVKILVYLRRQDKYIMSYYNQSIKSADYSSLTFDEYMKTAEDDLNADYLRVLDNIGKLIGDDNIIVRVYEKEQLQQHKHLAGDFLYSLGIEEDICNWGEMDYQNEKIGEELLQIKRLFNKELINDKYSKIREGCGIIFQKIASQMEQKEYNYFSKEESKALLRKYEQGNELIARRFLKREDGKLFWDDKIDERTEELTFKKHREEETEIISRIICEMYLKIEKQIEPLLMSSLNIRKGKRKLALFGAGKICKEILRDYDLQVDVIFDNYLYNGENELQGIVVQHPGTVANWKDYFIIITCKYPNEIRCQLESYGLTYEKDFLWVYDILG